MQITSPKIFLLLNKQLSSFAFVVCNSWNRNDIVLCESRELILVTESPFKNDGMQFFLEFESYFTLKKSQKLFQFSFMQTLFDKNKKSVKRSCVGNNKRIINSRMFGNEKFEEIFFIRHLVKKIRIDLR